jgi:hypothetical protein
MGAYTGGWVIPYAYIFPQRKGSRFRKNGMWGCGLDSTDMAYGPVVISCSTQGGNLVGQLCNYQLHKDSAPWSLLISCHYYSFCWSLSWCSFCHLSHTCILMPPPPPPHTHRSALEFQIPSDFTSIRWTLMLNTGNGLLFASWRVSIRGIDTLQALRSL